MKKKALILCSSILILLALFAVALFAYERWYISRYAMAAKPVIYLYPEEPSDSTKDASDTQNTTNTDDTQCDAKPVVYLYPDGGTEISVKLDYQGTLHYTYPTYENGWEVVAYPDGTIYSDGKEYSYLFWDGYSDIAYDMSEGFVVAGADTEAFLVEKLAFLGLTPTEYNEFIVYWLPQMINNAYNLITFQEEAYTDNAVLTITPEPDSIQRVFMAYSALEEPMTLPEQTLTPFTREGFTVIEWGGAAVSR